MNIKCPMCKSTTCSCSKNLNQPLINTITAQTLYDRMQQNKNLVVINTLQGSDYDICHISNSISIPMSRLPEEVIDWDRHQEIVVYCAGHTCPISKQAYLLLQTLGFQKIAIYEGGILEWAQKGFPTQGPCTL